MNMSRPIPPAAHPLFFLFYLLAAALPALAGEKDVSVVLREEPLLQAIRASLPIPIETESPHISGDIFVESLERLQLKEKSIFLGGVVASRNLVMKTEFGGQDFTMKLGSMRVPVTCELFLRFDRQGKKIYFTPRFPKTTAPEAGSSAEVLLPLLTAFGGSEYQVEFDSIQPYLATAAARPLPRPMEPIDLLTGQGLMVVKMRPRSQSDIGSPP